jgi:hypothetical protein
MSSDFYEHHAGLTSVAENLGGFGYNVVRGFNSDIVGQLIENSKQAHVMSATPDDMGSRFRNKSTFAVWWQEHAGLAPYVLLAPDSEQLSGIVWHHPAALPSDEGASDVSSEKSRANHTFALRMYEPHNGRGLAPLLMRASLLDYIDQPQSTEDFEGVWLRTSASTGNQRTVRLYSRFGYEHHGTNADKTRLTMVLSAKRVTQIQRAHAATVGD